MKKLLVFSLLFLVGAALFNPVKAQVPTSGLQLHLKADAGTSSAVSGQKISQWNDQSGNGNHAVENNPVWQPTYINDGGISVVRFNPAAPTSMNLPTHAALGIQNSEYEFFLVSRTSSQSAAQFALAGGLNFGEIQISGTNGVRFIASTGNFLDNPARVDNGVFHIINSIATTGNSELAVDGVYVTKSGNATHNINVGFNLGTRSDGFNRLDGDIAEILIYNRKLNNAESMQITEYLKNKYSTPFTAYGAPQTPASNLNFASVTQNSMNVNLSKGSGTHRLVIARRGSAVNAAPSNGTAYTGNASFGSGSQIGSGNYVVYAGTEGTSTAISNLTFDETYHFAVYEYYLVNGVPQYSSAITGSRSTPNLTPISTIQTTSRTGTSISGTLTKGSGTHRLIVARASSPVSVGPTNGVPYTGNSAFGSGSQIGSGNYVIYAGTDGTSFNLSSLSGSTVYYLALYEYTLVNGQPRYAISQSPVFSDITYPNTSASAIQFSNVGLNEITISFTPGDGQKRIVVAREALAVSAGPSDNQTYTANTAFGSGQDLGSGNFVIYNGTGNSVTMTGLSNTTTYHFAVYEYTEFNGNTYYKTSAPAVSSQSTTVVPLPVIATDANFGSGTATSREITGAINPSGFETTVEVLYGTDPGNLNLSTTSQSIGNGSSNVPITIDVTGLTTGQDYYAKFRATNPRGTVESSLTTLVPLTLTSMTGWFRADVADFTQSGAQKSFVTWTNLSGSGNHIGNQTPTVNQNPNSINGKPAATFNNSGFWFKPSEVGILNTDIEMYIVFKSSNNSAQDIFNHNNSRRPIVLNSNSGIRVNPSSALGAELTLGASTSYTDGNGYAMHFKTAQNRSQLRINNEPFTHKSGNNRFTQDDDIYMGINLLSPQTDNFYGDIAEILFFNSELSVEQRQEIAQYLSSRYAITVYEPSLPQTASNNLVFSNVGPRNLDVSFTAGDGEQRIIVARESGSQKTPPVIGNAYTANATFGTGSDLGNGNYVVYNGTGNSVAITGLSVSTEYTIDVYEFNVMELDPQYSLTSPNSASTTTQAITPPSIQLIGTNGLNATTATLTYLVNPNSDPTTVNLSYGTSISSLSSSAGAQVVGSQSTEQLISTMLSGLTSGTQYFYKVSATNNGGTTESEIGTFIYQENISLGSLQYWLAGDDPVINTSSGNAVEKWGNRAGKYLPASQVTINKRPQFISESGLNFLRFDGTDDFMNLPRPDSLGINNSDYEVFIVARSSAQSVGFLIAGASERYEIHTYLGGSVAGTRFIPKSSTYIDNAVNTTNGEFHLINATATATKGRLRVDGNTVVSNGINARSSSTESLLLGQRGGNFLNFDGDIAEVLIYNSELSDAQNLSVSEFLAQKYSITLNSYVAPTQQATAVTFDVFTADQITVSATSGNGSNRLFVVRESSVAAVPPIDGTIYTANTVFGSGSTTGAGNFVVSANSDNSVTVTGLTNNTTYTVDVYEYNVSGNDTRYLGSPATGYVTFYSSAIYSNRIAYVVNSTLDTDTGSVRKGTLRYVLNQINTRAADSTSIVDLRHLRGQITLTDDLPPLNYNTIVVGAGQDSLSISGNNLYRPFFIGAGIAPFTAENPAAPNITMDSFSIVNGRGKGGDGSNGGGGAAGMGGAIFINNGTVEIKNQSFSGNRAIGGNGNASGFAGGGGGFGGNGSGGTPGPSGYLGGFVPTSAGQSGGPGSGGYGSSDNGGNGGFGGGGASVNATSRTTNPGDGGFGGGSGGYGLTYIPGSGIGGFGAGVAAKNGSVAAGGGGAGFGGAIFNRFGNLILSNSHFSTNTATGGVGGSPGVNDGNSYGGAIFNYQGQILTASSTNSSNAADNENDYYNYNVGGSELAVTKLLPPSNITNPSATINATIQTLGYSGSYYVAYGTDPSTLSTSTSTVNYSAGNSVEPISISLTGLNLSSMLYYKLIVTNDLGTFESKVGSIINDNSIPSDSLQLWASADRGLELSENKLENWFDASGKSNSITQSNASAQPALVSNVINGKSVVRFNGTDTFLETPSTTDLGIQNSDYELFVVMQSSSSDLQFLYSGGPEDYEMQLNGSIGLRSIPESGKYLDAGTSAQFTNGQARILTSQITNTSGSVRVNDELLAHVGSSTRNSSSVKLRIGSRYEGSFDFNGDIAEIIIYNKALSTSERTTVMDYLSAKYNVDKVVITEPTVNASQPVVTNRNLTTVAFRVNKGSGANRIVVAREGAAPTQLPSDNQVYTANPTFGSGTEIGTGNYVVYNGSDSTFTVNGLTAGSTYHFAVLEYNGTFETDYLTSSYLSYSVTSLAEIPSVLAGSALRFGGDDETVMVTHTPAFNSAAVTMELWFKSDDSGTDYDFLTSKASEELEIHLGAEGVANTIRFIPASQVYIDSEPGVFTAGEWTHLAVVYDPSISLAKMYVNGEEVSITKKGSNPLTTPRNLSTNNFYLGSREGSALHYNGSLDEVKIWNTVRTVAEIREYMHKPVQTDYQDLIAYWQFNEGTGTALSDNGSALNGTLQNFEFNASNGWENSDVAFGAGTFTSVENVTSGSHALSSLTYALTEDFDNAVTLTSNTITTNPNVVPQNVTLHDTSYWIVKTLGSPGNYQATLTFTVPPTFISKGTAAVTQFNLYHRAENSTGNWSVLKSEASSFSSNSVSFSEIGVSGQFMISREINIDYDEVVGNAIKFDGVNDYISIQDNDILDVSKYTVQLWFNWNEGANNVEFIMAKSIQEFELHTIGSNNSLRFIPAPGVLVDSPPNAFTSNTWTHLTLIFDPSQSMAKMYFNGTEVTPVITGNLSTAIAHSSTPLAFGRRQDNSFYFNGQMDEIRLWNTVRTTAEIQEDMGKTTPDGFNEGLIGYWQFNEGTGTSTVERTFGLNGTLHNFDFNASSGWVESGAPILSAQEVQVTLTGSAGWRLLASPVQNATFETVLSSLWTQGGTGADTTAGTSNVFTWATSSSDNNAASWVPLTDYTRTFEQGEGVLMYVYSDDNGPRTGDSGFPKTLSVTGIALNQDATLTPRLNTNPGGWTLLGNPFSNSFDWDNATKTGLSATVYVWDHNGSEWKYWNGTVGNLPQGIVGSMNAFFVNTMNSSPTLTIPTASIVEGTPAFLGKKAQLPPIVSIQLDVEGKDSIMVYSQIVEQSLMGIDAHDAFWLQPLSATPELAFISPTGDLLSITSLPPSDQTMELPIHVDLADFGQGKLVLNTEELSERWTASLYDRVKNQYFANGEEVIIQPHQNNVVSLYQNDSGRLETTEEEASLSRETSPKKMNKEPSRFNGLPILPNPQKASSTESRFMLLLSPNVASSVIGELPTDFTLEQNYPNPFNPNTIIRFGLPVQSEIRLSVLDLLGRTVAQPVQGVQAAGWHTVTFDASSLSSGIYFYTLEIDGRLHQTKKMTLIK